MSIEKVNELIKDCHEKYDIEYGGYLANHTLHGLIALYGLNEKDEIIEEWYKEYEKHDYSGIYMEPAKPFDPSVVINDENLHSFIGSKKNFQELFEFYKNELRSNSLDDLVKKYYPKLKEGVAGGALHGLIHFGWAIYYRHSEIALAEGFAYLTYVNLPLSFPFEVKWINEGVDQEINTKESEKQRSEELFQIFFQVKNDRRFQEMIQSDFFSENGFQERLKKTALTFNQIIFEDFSSKIPPININHLIISLSKLFLYTNANDFFLLHIITSLFSIFHILSFSLDEKMKLWVLWNFYHLSLIVYIAEGSPDLIPRYHSYDINDLPSVDSDWPDLVHSFLTDVPSRNEHILKIVLVMKEFDKALPSYSNLFKHIALDAMKKNQLILFSQRKQKKIKYSTPSTR